MRRWDEKQSYIWISLYPLFPSCRFSDLSLCPLKWKIHVWWTKSLDGAERRYGDISSTRPVENAMDFSMEVWAKPDFFSHQTKKIVDNNTASLFRGLFLELLSLVIGEREREQNIFGLWKEVRPNWGATSRLLCPYIVNSKLQKQIGIGSISSSKTATLN